MTMRFSFSLFSRKARWAAALAGAAVAATAPGHAQTVDPAAAPASWVRYAEGATNIVTRLLRADTETAMRLRAYLDQTRPAPDQPTAPLMLKLWVDREGMVTRIAFAPFAHAEPNQDLQSLIVGQTLDGVPPKDMLLPLRILIQLPPVPPVPGDRTTALDEANREIQPASPARRPVTDPLGLPERGGVNRLGLEGEPGTKPPTQH